MAVFLATPESFMVVRCGFPTLLGQNVRKTRYLKIAVLFLLAYS